MKQICSFLFALLLSIPVFSQDKLVSPIQSGAYIPGIMNIRDYENPHEGNLWVLDNDFIFANSKAFNDKHGTYVNEIDLGETIGKVPIDTNVDAFFNRLSIKYITNPIDFLGGAKMLFSTTPMYVSNNIFLRVGNSLTEDLTYSESGGGFGDLAVIPFNLLYSFNEIWDFSIGYSFVAPTGKFEVGADNNIGAGYWSHIVQAVGYYFPYRDKTLAIMISPSYEFHGLIKDTDVRPGDRFNVEYGASQYIAENFEVYLQGGHTMQITDDEGEDVYWDTSYYDRLNNFGVGVGYWPIPFKFYLNAKWYETYSNRQHFDADFFQLQLLYIL